MNRGLQVVKYLIADWISASIAWVILYVFRKKFLEVSRFGKELPLEFDENFFYGLLFVPLFWIALYIIAGQYTEIYRKHRLKEVGQTLLMSIIGVVVIFFVLLLDDQIVSYKNYYQSLLVLFGAHFGLTVLFRLILTTRTVKQIHKGKIGFNTIVVGGNENALDTYEEIQTLKKSPGFKFLGFVQVNGKDTLLEKHLRNFGKYHKLPELIRTKNVEEIILAVESTDHKELGLIMNLLEGEQVSIKIIPDVYDILSGSVKMTSIFGAPLIAIEQDIMPAWQFSIKRTMDILMSLIAVIILSPVILLLTILVKTSSPGPVFFTQERVGKKGKPFKIIKFRTMVQDAEKNGPQLSSSVDSRITPIGKFLRKTRLDEIPQFFNVLKGEMALVGPRPERQYYIDLITERTPHYKHLQKVRPGITSWGQVKYGYAENVDQMVQRLKYDLLYIENMSIAVDIKILLYTIITVLKGDGK
ncbi:MAG: sugar transferase [Flavobacteriales bacterium]|nr:sugar transferase [Flavobacteriales bacterium]